MTDQLKQQLTIGRELYERHDYAGAEPYLREVLSLRDDLADVHHMLGVIQHDRGELAEARLCFERALLLNPDYTEAALNLSIVCNELGAYTAAREVVGTISERARHGQPSVASCAALNAASAAAIAALSGFCAVCAAAIASHAAARAARSSGGTPGSR